MSEEQNKDTIGALKTRVANMLINTVSLSETINILRDFCVKRGEELVDNATEEQLENIKKLILSLGTIVEERVRMATKAIEDNDAELAQRIIKSDFEIDEMEVDIEEECLKVLALHQPVAIDLRFIIFIMMVSKKF